MTKEQFEQEMLKWVTFYKEKLEQTNLRCAKFNKQVGELSDGITFNPFLEFDEKYFNIRILSNLQGLNMVIDQHPELKSHEVTLFIISNYKYKVLNQMLNYDRNLVNELKNKIYSPMDIAIGYARYCKQCEKFKNMPKR